MQIGITLRLNNCTLAMPPARLNRIQPGAFDRQLGDDDPHSAIGLGLTVMLFDPLAHLTRDMPRSIIPNQQPCLLPVAANCSQPQRETPWSGGSPDALGQSATALIGGWPQQPLTSQRHWIRIVLLFLKLDQSQRFIWRRPSRQIGLCQTLHQTSST
jgi:hypothetical protein